jgi:hypothetical protein
MKIITRDIKDPTNKRIKNWLLQYFLRLENIPVRNIVNYTYFCRSKQPFQKPAIHIWMLKLWVLSTGLDVDFFMILSLFQAVKIASSSHNKMRLPS